MSHVFRPPIEIVVTIRAALPYSFVWQEETHFVEQILNAWIDDTEWWEEAPLKHDNYMVTTDTGLMVNLYWDRAATKWFLELKYD